MSTLSMSGGGSFVDRSELSIIPTPQGDGRWCQISHEEVVTTLIENLQRRNLQILNEEYGLARDGSQRFDDVRIAPNNESSEWTRCIGVRNSHDKTLSFGLTAEINVVVCSNLCFGGSYVIKRRHIGEIDVPKLVENAVENLDAEFSIVERMVTQLKREYITDDLARSNIVRIAECGGINSSDILPVYREYKEPRHKTLISPTNWGLLNACTEIIKKYTPSRLDLAHRAITHAFSLNTLSQKFTA